MKKYIYIGSFVFLLFSYYYLYNKGYENGKRDEKEVTWIANQSIQNAISEAAPQIAQSNAIINNNTTSGECFDRVWAEDVVETVNNILR